MKRNGGYQQYHFAAVVHGECCSRGHLWHVTVRARNDGEALRKLKRAVGEYTLVEYARMSEPFVGTVEDTSEAQEYV